MTLPADTVVETFVTGSETDLVKNDSQGCAGQAFNVSDHVATLANSGHSCDIPGGVYTAKTATFALSADTKSMTTTRSATLPRSTGSAGQRPPPTCVGAPSTRYRGDATQQWLDASALTQ